MKLIYKTITTLAVVYSMLMLTACPANLGKLQTQSARVAKYANAGVDLTRNLYEGKVITLAQKDQIAQKFVLLAQGGIAFDAAVAKAQAAYGSNAPSTEVQKLFATFDAEVVGKFLDILKTLGLSAAVTSKYGAIIEMIRTAVLVIAGAFGQKAAVANKLAV